MNVRLGVGVVSVHVSELSPPSTAKARSHRMSVTRYDTTYRTLARWNQISIRRASRPRAAPRRARVRPARCRSSRRGHRDSDCDGDGQRANVLYVVSYLVTD